MPQVLERRNVYSGRLYREDPTILAFNLVNEPRCSTVEVLQRSCRWKCRWKCR